jgi:hypothetical protein
MTKKRIVVTKGDFMGHPFRGNQWTGGRSHKRMPGQLSFFEDYQFPMPGFPVQTDLRNVGGEPAVEPEPAPEKPDRNQLSMNLFAGQPDVIQEQLSDTSSWSRIGQRDKDYGVSKKYFVNIEGDGKAIVKPGTDSYSAYDENSPYKDADAYELAKDLGFDSICPPATTVKVGNEMASVAQLVENCTPVGIFSDERGRVDVSEVDTDSFEQVAWLDAINGNTDRHGRNLLIQETDDGTYRAVAIDHNLAFMTQERMEACDRAWLLDSNYKPINLINDKLDSIIYDSGDYQHTYHKEYFLKAYDLLSKPTPTRQRLQERYGEDFIKEALERVVNFANEIEESYGWDEEGWYEDVENV